MRRGLAAMVGLLLAACATPITEIVVEVSSDLAVPGSIDGLSIDVMREGATSISSTARLGPSEPPLPRALTLVYRGGALGPIRVEARATLAGETVVSASRVVSFVPSRRARLHIDLSLACSTGSCASPLTCGNDGACRDPHVSSCELVSETCDDASAPADGGASDGAPGGCALAAGLCAPESAMLGDRIALAPCADPSGATISYETRAPSGSISTETSLLVDRPGVYEITATASTPASCTTVHHVTVAPFAATSSSGRPAVRVRDLAARLGASFLATDHGPWAVTQGGWRDLRMGATGTSSFDDFATVVVRDGEAFFGGVGDRTSILRVRAASDLSAVELFAIPIPDAGDWSARAMSVPIGALASGDAGPIAFASKEGVLLLEGTPSALVARTVSTSFEGGPDVAVGAREPVDRGAVWALGHDDRLRNVATGAALAFAGGAGVPMDATSRPHALAVDERGSSPLLVVCAESPGLQIFDLGIDWTARSTLPPPLATLSSFSCNDVAVGGEGDLWAATTRGLFRIDAGGSIVSSPTPEDGIGAVPVMHVATAWGSTTREVWALTQEGDVHVVAAAPLR